MISLSRPQRGALLFVSASAYLAWFSGYDGRIDAKGLAASHVPTLTIAARRLPQRVASLIRRDPFVRESDDPRGGALPHAGNATTTASEEGSDASVTVPNIAGTPDATTLADGNDGASGGGGSGFATLIVRATIIGADPIAYVANGSTMDIVRVGDRIGERRIASIDLRGIEFADGTRLDLPGSFMATPAPRTPGGAVTIKLADLRKLLSSTAGAPLAPPAKEATSPLPPAATPISVSYPTAGPLPTVDPRGIPVGTNPTPDANGPTPFPIPYPYAPPHR